LKDDKEITEDEQKRFEKDFEAKMKDFTDKIETAFKNKEKEILTI
jgi:ribosome recycling factor